MLEKSGFEVTVLDNLSIGHQSLVKYGKLVVGDLADRPLLEKLLSEHDFQAVINFAAFSVVGESIN